MARYTLDHLSSARVVLTPTTSNGSILRHYLPRHELDVPTHNS